MPVSCCRITLIDALDSYLSIHATKESTWGSLFKCIFDVHPKSMYSCTNDEVDFSLKCAFPQLFKRHIRVQYRQIINKNVHLKKEAFSS